jgi:uncharacterized RmlC-like cupin family protein
MKMAETKYGKYVKKLIFKDYGPGSFRQGTKMDSEFLGVNVNIEYGTYWSAGRIGKEPYEPHKHDFDQVLYWLGGDTDDMGELHGEVELCLGEEMEKHMITTTTAVFIPKGMPHLPATINRMGRRFILMVVSIAGEYKAIPVTTDKGPSDFAGMRAKYRQNVVNVPFQRKGAWSYGPLNPDDSGGSLAFIRTNLFNFLIMSESLKKAPYRFGPLPDEPHAHNQPEILVFMGADTSDLSVLGGEVEISLGEEKERHIFNEPTAVICPAGLLHCPLTITKVEKPFILSDVRPFGSGYETAGQMGVTS